MKKNFLKNLITFSLAFMFTTVPVLAEPIVNLNYNTSNNTCDISLENLDIGIYSVQVEFKNNNDASNYNFNSDNDNYAYIKYDNNKNITICVDNSSNFLNTGKTANLGTLSSSGSADLGTSAKITVVDKNFKGTTYNIPITSKTSTGSSNNSNSSSSGTGTVIGTGNGTATDTNNKTQSSPIITSDNNFSDTQNHWAKDAISYLSEKGIINGITSTQFAPNNNIKRSEFVTLLAKIDNINISEYKTDKFNDVKHTDWFSPYVAWAQSKGITNGISETQFAPDSYITREQMALMIYKLANYKKFSLDEVTNKINFNDSNNISSYASNAIETIQKAGIINGKNNNNFAPKDTATRAEASQMLYKLLINQEKIEQTTVQEVK